MSGQVSRGSAGDYQADEQAVGLGLPTAMKLGFDRDHSNRGNFTISGETASLLRG